MIREQSGTREHLNLCGHCGKMARRWMETSWGFFISFFVQCTNSQCGMRTGNFDSSDQADDVWNRRFNLLLTNQQQPPQGKGGI